MHVIGVFKVSRPAVSINAERDAGLNDFPVFPEDVRWMDYLKCAYDSLADAKAYLSKKHYDDLVSDLKKNDPDRSLDEAYARFQARRVFFHLEAAPPQELAEYQGCILKSEKLNGKLIKRFQRNPVYLNF